MGLTCSDQRQPGSKTPRPRVWLPTLITSIFPFPSLNGRVSSGLLRDFRSNAVICLLQKRSGRVAASYRATQFPIRQISHIPGNHFLGLGPGDQRPSVGLPGPLCAVDFKPAVSAPTSAWATEDWWDHVCGQGCDALLITPAGDEKSQRRIGELISRAQTCERLDSD